MKKKSKKMITFLVTVAMLLEPITIHAGFASLPSQAENKNGFIYDAGYQHNEHFAFIRGGSWGETLSEDAKVIFINAKTQEHVEYEVNQDGKRQFDSIEPISYMQNEEVVMASGYRLMKGNKQAVVESDGRPYEGELKWYDSVEMCGECVITSMDGKRQMIGKVDGKVVVLEEELWENAQISYQDGFYFISQYSELKAYNQKLEKMPDTFSDEYHFHNQQQYIHFNDCGYAVVSKKIEVESKEPTSTLIPMQTAAPATQEPAKDYSYNVVDKNGAFVFDHSMEETAWQEPYSIHGNCLLDEVNQCLYSLEDWHVIKDTEMILEDLTKYFDSDVKWEVSDLSINVEGSLSVSGWKKTSDLNGERFKLQYSSVDGYTKPIEGSADEVAFFDNGNKYWYMNQYYYNNGYLVIAEENVLYDFRTGEKLTLPKKEGYEWFSICDKFGEAVVELLQCEKGTRNYTACYFASENASSIFYILKDGCWKEYSADAVQSDATGCYLSRDDSGNVSLYNRYGRLLLGDREKYSAIGTPYIGRDVLVMSQTADCGNYVQNGYTVAADDSGKYGIVKLPVSGDLNSDGIVNLLDANIALKSALDIITLTDALKLAADVNCDNRVTLEDAYHILRAALIIRPLKESY